MRLFINDIPVRILEAGASPEAGTYNHTIDAASEAITQAKLINHVWVKNVDEAALDVLLESLNSKVPTHLLSLVISAADLRTLKKHLRRKFKVVQAAGGLVRKKEKFLMIYRLKKWDLPKGKREKDEGYRRTAVREVEEECNVSVKIGPKICTTWHTYTMNRNAMLKKTKWYLMDCSDDSGMRPATEEDIEDLRWMTPKEVYHALEHSYKSIQHVFERYYKKAEIKPL